MKKLTQKQIHILDVVEELISQKGFDNTSIREISAKANVNVAMVSYYFGSKEGMMAALYLYRVQKTKGMFFDFYNTIADDLPEIQLSKIINFLLEQLIKYHYFHQFVTQELKITDEVNSIMLDFYKSFAYVLDDVIQRGIAKGVFRYQIKSENIITSLLGTIFFSIRNRNFYECYLEQNDSYTSLKQIEMKLKKHLNQMVFSLLGYHPES